MSSEKLEPADLASQDASSFRNQRASRTLGQKDISDVIHVSSSHTEGGVPSADVVREAVCLAFARLAKAFQQYKDQIRDVFLSAFPGTDLDVTSMEFSDEARKYCTTVLQKLRASICALFDHSLSDQAGTILESEPAGITDAPDNRVSLSGPTETLVADNPSPVAGNTEEREIPEVADAVVPTQESPKPKRPRKNTAHRKKRLVSPVTPPSIPQNGDASALAFSDRVEQLRRQVTQGQILFEDAHEE